MKVAVDYGSKRCGVAWGKEFPSRKDVVSRKDLLPFLKDLSPSLVIFGLPLSMSGRYSCQTFEAIKLAEKVRFSLRVPVYLVDERLSTKMAHDILKKTGSSTPVDAVSASLIFESFSKNPEGAYMVYDEVPKVEIPDIAGDAVLIHEVPDTSVLEHIHAERLDVLQSDPYVAYLFKKKVRFVERFEDFLEGDYDIILTTNPGRVRDLLSGDGRLITVRARSSVG